LLSPAPPMSNRTFVRAYRCWRATGSAPHPCQCRRWRGTIGSQRVTAEIARCPTLPWFEPLIEAVANDGTLVYGRQVTISY
jgi:hypothetical protein